MTDPLAAWLLDTLVWTAVLLGLVLVLRRPVARIFGPQLAYSLWLLPFARLLLPPITLPAWMAPAPAEVAATAHFGEQRAVLAELAAAPVPATALEPAFDWIALLLAAWLCGAVIFLTLRFQAYFKMRDMLLGEAVPVGECGKVRFVETSATAAPLAFGVIDKVVALPPAFMASADKRARDLALEHELSHHRRGDLLVNFVIQPLFALHWFNPLGHAGWRAMRRDQEAACDARVVAKRSPATRAAYGEVIAGFAAGPQLTPKSIGAAPMACPVLGDKSIIQRLRSLNMSEISHRRRLAGRIMIAAGALALPLTASVSYAENTVVGGAVPPPPAPAKAPPAPKASADWPAAPLAPEAPKPPETAMAEDGEIRVERIIVPSEKDGETKGKATITIVQRGDGDGTEVERRIVRKVDVHRLGEPIEIEQLERKVETMRKHLEDREFDIRGLEQALEGMDFAAMPTIIRCKGEGWETGSKKVSLESCLGPDVGELRLRSLKSARAALAKSQDLPAERRAKALAHIDKAIAALTQD